MSLWLSACGGSGNAPNTAAQTPQTAMVANTLSTLSCTPNEQLTGPNGSTLINNTWNSTAAGSNAWSQCLQSRTLPVNGSGSTVQHGWRWNWPDTAAAVFAYPELVVGINPWGAGPGNDARFPALISGLRTLNIQFAAETSTAGSHNLAVSMWLIQTPLVARDPQSSDIKGEVMVWTDYTDDMVVDPGTTTKRGEFTDANGLVFDVWADENWGDASKGASNPWVYVAYHLKPNQRRLAAKIDLKAILRHAASLKDSRNRSLPLINTDWHVADVELGNEIVSGHGETWLTDFAVTMALALP